MIQNEVDALLTEVDSISSKTNFNGVSLLDGGRDSVTFQIGINASDALNVALQKSDTQSLGLSGSKGVSALSSERIDKTNYATATLAKSDVKINGFDALAADYAVNLTADANSALSVATAINANSGVHGATADAFNNVTSAQKGPFAQSGTFTINANTVAVGTSYETTVANINESVNGVNATLNADNTITLANTTGRDIVIAEVSTTGAADVGFTVGTYSGMVSLENNDKSIVKIEAGSVNNGYTGGKGTIADVNGFGFNENSAGNVLESAVVSGAAIKADELKLNDVLIGPSDNGSALSIAAAINSKTSEHGVTANAKTEAKFTIDASGIPSKISVNGSNVSLTGVRDTAGIVSKINSANIGDIQASTDSNGKLILTSESGVDIKVSNNTVKSLTSNFITSYEDVNGTTSNFGLNKGISDRDFVSTAAVIGAGASATLTTAATVTAAGVGTNLNSFVSVTDVAGNDQSGNTFTVTGTDVNGDVQTEAIVGPIASKHLIGTKIFNTISSVVATNSTTGNVSIGLAKSSTDVDSLVTSTTIAAAGDFTLTGSLKDAINIDAFVVVSSVTNDSADSITITGTDRFGTALTEIIAGGNATASQTENRFGTVTSISTNAAMGAATIGTTKDLAALTTVNESFGVNGLVATQDIAVGGGNYTTGGAAAAFSDLGAVVTLTVTADESAISFTISGTDMDGQATSETFVGGTIAGATGIVTGQQIFKTISTVSASGNAANVQFGVISVYDNVDVQGNLTLTTAKDSTIKIDTVAPDPTTAMAVAGTAEKALQKIGLQKQSQSFEVTGKGLDVGTLAGATSSLAAIDSAIAKVSSFRSSFGAVENRIDASVNNLTTLKINTQAAQSRIEDADFASETSNMTKGQILSQAATSMLAQANASKQNLLALLQG